ncbi:MAG TPA: acyl-CoA synthetase [Zeimonas sp.]|nr:acyl-CoA synthetase [Zeimonas sp.]
MTTPSSPEGLLVSGERSIGRSQLTARAARAARGLASLGVRAGDAVALLMRNDPVFLEASLAAARLGAYTVPLNWHFAPAELAYVLDDCEAKVLVVHADLLPLLRPSLASRPQVAVLVVDTPAEVQAAYPGSAEHAKGPADLANWDAWLTDFECWDGPSVAAPESVIYTSGTTGRPKGVRRSPATPEQRQRIERMRERVYGLRPGIRLIVPAPLYHAAPNVFAMRGLQVAERLVLMPRFDAEELLRLIEKHRATTLVMVPTMFVRLLRLPAQVRQRYDVSSLEGVYHAAAPCPVDVKREMIDWWGPVINEWYGTTESSVVTWCDSADWLRHPGTVGKPIDGATIEIVDEQGRCVPAGQAGEVFVGLEFYPDFTYHKRDEDRRRIGRGRLVSGGDIGYLDSDGYLHLCDRKRDMIISGGVNLYPSEIEAALLGIRAVLDCAVIGVPDAEYGEAVLALVVQDGTTSEAQLREELSQKLARYKVPRRIEFRATLPRDDAGKLLKRLLREPYWQGAERRI